MKTFLTVVLSLLCLQLFAQYVPNNAQAYQFMPLINTGFSGIEDFNDLKLSYRYQWAGFGEYSPKFVNVSYNTRLKKPVDLSYNSLRPSNPAMMHLPRLKRSVHGLAGHLIQSKIGVIETIGGGVTYAFHLPIIRSWKIAIGAGALIENRRMDVSQVTVRDPDRDSYYNHLLNSSTNQTDFNVRGSVLFYSRDFYFGLTYLPIINEAIQASDLAYNDVFYKVSFQTGKSFELNPNLHIKPSIVAYYLINDELILDTQVKAYIQDKVWTGLGYRSVKSGLALIGFNFTSMLAASYSYEVMLGDFQQFGGSTHEIVLAMKFKDIRKSNQYTW